MLLIAKKTRMIRRVWLRWIVHTVRHGGWNARNQPASPIRIAAEVTSALINSLRN